MQKENEIPKIMYLLQAFLNMELVKSSPYLWPTAVLSYGSLVYKCCAYNTPCPQSAVQVIRPPRNNQNDQIINVSNDYAVNEYFSKLATFVFTVSTSRCWILPTRL